MLAELKSSRGDELGRLVGKAHGDSEYGSIKDKLYWKWAIWYMKGLRGCSRRVESIEMRGCTRIVKDA